MRTAIQLTAAGDWTETVAFVTESERLGVDVCWVAEAWGTDAATPLGYLAARTEKMMLGSGIFQLGVRSSAMTAMTAMTLQHMTEGRFLLGLGASGPQVMEGLHGVNFERPLDRMRDAVEVLRLAEAGERIEYSGRTESLPRPGGEGKPLRLAIPRSEVRIPLYIAALSPAMLRFTGEVADGWQGTSFVPEGADEAFYSHIRNGMERSGRKWTDLDVSQGAEVAFGDDLDEMIQLRKPGLAFSLGGMGSATTNFYNSAYSRLGFAEAATQVQDLWTVGRRDEAAAAVPDELVIATTLIGPESHVKQRLRAWRDAGVTTLRLYPAGETLDERLTTLGQALDLVRSLE